MVHVVMPIRHSELEQAWQLCYPFTCVCSVSSTEQFIVKNQPLPEVDPLLEELYTSCNLFFCFSVHLNSQMLLVLPIQCHVPLRHDDYNAIIV